MANLILFLDDGGVMSDNRRRSVQWQQMVGEFLATVLGGKTSAWSEANRLAAIALFEADAWAARIRASHSYADFDRTYRLDWIGRMCQIVGVGVPGEEESLELAGQMMTSIPPRVRADFPGVVQTVKQLHAHGYPLNTASGESSADLSAYLGGMGIRHCFDRLYGPDLVDTFKDAPDYYRKIFADAGVAPANTLVIDDNFHATLRAGATGARTVLVTTTITQDTRITAQIRSLIELPSVLNSLDDFVRD